MSAEDVIEAKRHLGVANTESFHVPEACYLSARLLMQHRTHKFSQWTQSFETVRTEWDARKPELMRAWGAHFTARSGIPLSDADWQAAKGKMATRVASGKALAALARTNPALVGGSADLAGSNLTTLPETTFVNSKHFAGRNIHFGVREHGMGAICNGMALHGGFVPFCATFAVFSDYMRPTIRLAALMRVPHVFVLTHDSYAVGEDGPTHQPIEHAAALRAVPDLCVLRPADALETFAAWEHAVTTARPTVLLLTRQDVPDLHDEGAPVRSADTVRQGMRDGAYLLRDFGRPEASQPLVLVASGSEVSLALRTARLLEQSDWASLKGEIVSLKVRVVSAPAPQVLAQNPLALNSLVPKNVPAVAIEAGSSQGWGEIVGREGAICSMSGFGASAPAEKLAQHFGFEPDALSRFVLNHLRLRPA